MLIKLSLVREDSERTWWWPLNGQSAVLWKRRYLCESAGEGNGNPLHCSCLGNPMDRGAWWAMVHGVAKNQTRLSYEHTHTCESALRKCFTARSLYISVPTQKMRVHSLGWEDLWKEEMTTHSSSLAWEFPWTEEPGRLQFMGSQKSWHDLVIKQQQHNVTCISLSVESVIWNSNYIWKFTFHSNICIYTHTCRHTHLYRFEWESLPSKSCKECSRLCLSDWF